MQADHPTLHYAESHNLVGRYQELDRVRSLLARDEASAVFLVGESGVGKSAIANRIVEMTNAGALSERFQRAIVVSLFLEPWAQALPRLAEDVLGRSIVLNATEE